MILPLRLVSEVGVTEGLGDYEYVLHQYFEIK